LLATCSLAKLDNRQFDEMCDLIIYSHEEGIRKPERRIFELTCARLGLQPGEILFLDDVEENVAAAREFRMQAVLFQNTTQAITDVETLLQAVDP
jgi:putative hydrolase of the HAD superfamily